MAHPLLRRVRGDLTLTGFGIAGCVVLLLLAATFWLSVQQRTAMTWTAETREVLRVIANTRAALVDIQNGHRGFTIEGTQQSLEPYRSGVAAVERESARLRGLLRGSAAQQENLAQLDRIVAARLASAAELVEARRTGGMQAVQRLLDTGWPAVQMTALRGVLEAMEAQQERVLAERLHEQEGALLWFRFVLAAVWVVLTVALTLLYLLVRRRRADQRRLLESEERFNETLQHLNRSLEGMVADRTRELQMANTELRAARGQLQALSGRLIEVQEQERRHVARELHDETGQALTAIRMNLADVVRGGDPAERMAESMAIVDRAIAQIRGMALRLRPTMLDDLGLAEALEWILDQQSALAGWTVELDTDADCPRLLPQVETACFRIAQEALTNAARHARATHVRLRLRAHDERVELSIEDDGVGFDLGRYRLPEERMKHFGLVSMTERAHLVGGTLEIDTAVGRGARVRLTVPVAAQEQPALELVA